MPLILALVIVISGKIEPGRAITDIIPERQFGAPQITCR